MKHYIGLDLALATALLGGRFSRPAQSRESVYRLQPPDEHVYCYRRYLEALEHKQRMEMEQEARRERDRHIIEAAEAKRARKRAKALRTRHTSEEA